MSEKKYTSLATKVIHSAHHKNPEGALSTPIFQTSTFVFDSTKQGGDRFAGRDNGFIYTRLGNPTTRQLEEKIAALEDGKHCVAFSSGMGAIAGTTLSLLKSGDHLLADKTLYGCTFDLFNEQFPQYGIEVEFIDCADLEQIKKSMRKNTRMLYFETPANPNLKIVDIKEAAAIAHGIAPKCIVVVDNTFATPLLTEPLTLGTDVVVHSATKYLNGHGDVIAGFSITNDDDIHEKIRFKGLKDITGSVLGPQEAYLILRGLKTMKIRMDAHCRNGMLVAKFLASSPLVEKVYFPGLENHPGHAIAKKQMRDYGAMISFEVKSFEMAAKMMNSVKMIALAVSLGDCESLIQHPASMTHSAYTKEEILAAGFSDCLIRLSVGLEDAQDIIDDLQQALEAASH